MLKLNNGSYTLKQMKQLTGLKTKGDISSALAEDNYSFTYIPKQGFIILGQPNQIINVYDITEDMFITKEQISKLINCETNDKNFNRNMKAFLISIILNLSGIIRKEQG